MTPGRVNIVSLALFAAPAIAGVAMTMSTGSWWWGVGGAAIGFVIAHAAVVV